MAKRLENKIAIVVGAGQTPGQTIGNGRAMATLFAREGATVMLVDMDIARAIDTKAAIDEEGGSAFAFEADITKDADCKAIIDKCVDECGRIDVLVYNVGIGSGDRGPTKLSEEDWDHIFDVNLKGMFRVYKHVLPVMEDQESGSIITISSAAAVCNTSMTAYKVSKAGVNAMTHMVAMRYAKKGIRVNTIMPGLMNTPMAIEGISASRGIPRDDLIAARDANVPLKGGMGDGWDTAYAALFLASDESKFVTSVILPVDGGQSAKIG